MGFITTPAFSLGFSVFALVVCVASAIDQLRNRDRRQQ